VRNPFVFGRPVGGESFLNRKRELAEFQTLLFSGNNLILTSRRQTGKTSLLLQLSERLKAEGCLVVYLDLFLVKGLEEFLEYFLGQTTRAARKPLEKAAAWVKLALTSVRPVFSLDEQGGFSVSLGAFRKGQDQNALLKEILDLPLSLEKGKGKRAGTVIILDEFQRLYEIGGVDLEKKMRAIMQRHRGINYIFAGSNSTMLQEAFQSVDRPFYEWGVQRFLGPLERTELSAYVRKCFGQRRLVLGDAILDSIYTLCDEVPNYIQMFFFNLWNLMEDKTEVTEKHVEENRRDLLANNGHLYSGILAQLSGEQVRLLKGIAIMGGAHVSTAEFLQRNRLKNTALVAASIKSLLKKNVLEKDGKTLQIRDPFFKLWLKTIP
jgi:AAA+ ATPase superfamily predicted ATPase